MNLKIYWKRYLERKKWVEEIEDNGYERKRKKKKENLFIRINVLTYCIFLYHYLSRGLDEYWEIFNKDVEVIENITKNGEKLNEKEEEYVG